MVYICAVYLRVVVFLVFEALMLVVLRIDALSFVDVWLDCVCVSLLWTNNVGVIVFFRN